MSTNGTFQQPVSSHEAREMFVTAVQTCTPLTVLVSGAKLGGRSNSEVAERILNLMSSLSRECECGKAWGGIHFWWDREKGTISVGSASRTFNQVPSAFAKNCIGM